ncbi:hypothetical protein M9Y10_027520 [Tritrichomonas musculus]|uniref:Uncharacterized protein n=1 Tax=Tritrichomonas musculus TaxID=1915356 RepID=A0ABR2H6E4_9EUKA
MNDFKEKSIKQSRLRYPQSREKKDDFLLKNQSNLSEVIEKIPQSFSSKVQSSYANIDKIYSSDNRDLRQLTQEMTNLYLFAFDNFIDSDENFKNYNIYKNIIGCLNGTMPIELRKATIAFLTNIFQYSHTRIMDYFISDYNIIEYIYNIYNEDIQALMIPLIQCATNIASESRSNRDKILEKFDLNTISDLLNDYPTENTFIAASHLISSYCQYPLDEKYFSSILSLIYQIIFKSLDHNWQCSEAMKAMISYINTEERCKIFASLSNQPDNPDNIIFQSFISLLKEENDEITVLLLIFLNKLFEKIQNTLEIDFEYVLKLFDSTNEIVAWHAIRLFSNSIVLNPLVCESFNPKEPDQKESNLQKLLDCCKEGSGKKRIESLFLLTNLIRKSPVSSTIFTTLCTEEKIVPLFVDSLNLEDPELVDAIICSFARILQSEIPDTDRKKVLDKFQESGGDEVIEMLIQNEDENISMQALAFKNIILEKPTPFNFESFL